MLVGGVSLVGLASRPAGQTTSPRMVFAAIYSKGTAWTDDQHAFQHPSIQQHIQHFRSLGDRLLGAAPFGLDPSDRAVGMVLLLADSPEAARAWGAADPAVVANVMVVKVYRWRVDTLRGL
jgi:hypothetical protein